MKSKGHCVKLCRRSFDPFAISVLYCLTFCTALSPDVPPVGFVPLRIKGVVEPCLLQKDTTKSIPDLLAALSERINA